MHQAMRRAECRSWLLAVLAVLVSVGLSACGSGGVTAGNTNSKATSNSSTSKNAFAPAPVNRAVDADHDNDVGAPYDDANNSMALDFGHPASPTDRRVITHLVKRYYAAALASNGRKACSMLYSTLAEAAPEDDSREPGSPPYMQNDYSCAEVLDDLFKHFHPQLAVELPVLKVTRVRVQDYNAFAFLSFGPLAERRISLSREGPVWKLSQIYDEELP